VAEAQAAPTPLARHMGWVGALIDAGMLVQGLLDARFEREGQDRPGQPELALLHP
jgi:hypothetical protein